MLDPAFLGHSPDISWRLILTSIFFFSWARSAEATDLFTALNDIGFQAKADNIFEA